MLFFGTLILYAFLYLGLHLYFTGAKLFYILSVALFIASLSQRPKIIQSKINLSLILMLAVMTLSVPFSSYIRTSYILLVDFTKIVIISFITYHTLNSKNKISVFLGTWLAYHVWFVGNTLTTFNIDEAAIRYGAVGLSGTSFLGDANDFALALNIALPFTFYMMPQIRKNIVKGLLALVWVLLLIGIVMSNSRGGLITLVLTMGFIILIRSKRRIIGLTIGALLVSGIYFLAPKTYVERMQTITSGSALKKGDTGYGRITLWKAGLEMMIDHPFTGVGLGRYPSSYGYEYHREDDSKWRVAHNSYITVGAETGIAGFLFYFYLLYTIFKENYGIRKSLRIAKMENHFVYFLSKALTAALVAYCVGSLFLTAWHYIHIYLIIALTLAIKRIMVEEYGFELQDDKDKALIRQ